MDRITEKLKRAAGVAQRAAASIESEADKLIAREDELASRTQSAFAPHHAMLDSRNRELNQLEDALQIVSNGAPPLPDTSPAPSATGGDPPVNPPQGLLGDGRLQQPLTLNTTVLPPAQLQTSQAGIDLIVTEEDGGKVYYTQHYQSFEYPGGASGPTVGIGYDLGYATPDQIKKDWSGIVAQGTLEMLIVASGLKGDRAHTFVQQHKNSVSITWDQAMAEFMRRELPKQEAQNRQFLPNYDQLPGDCAGALDSLTYNRGVGGYTLPGDRYREMRSIRDLLKIGNLKAIPAEFLSMRRLWPVGGDLWKRREHEASLFAQGLEHDAAAPRSN